MRIDVALPCDHVGGSLEPIPNLLIADVFLLHGRLIV